MLSQIFKTSPPIEILFDFLGDICEKKSNKYVFSRHLLRKHN